MVNPAYLLHQPLGTFTTLQPHPSFGGNPYDDPWHQSVITLFNLGIPLSLPDLDLLPLSYDYPSLQTCMRYIEQYRQYGYWQPERATGNHEAERKVFGQALTHLVLYCVVHPDAPISHVREFLFIIYPTVALYFP